MAEPGFRELQYGFTAHMRDPARHPPPPGIEDRRLEIYRGLLYRNVEGFMCNAFPVLRKLTDDTRWHAMIRDYFARHEARTPLFPKMPQEFLHYLADERSDADDPPFLYELAHYEWLEAEVMFDTREVAADDLDASADLPAGWVIPNPVMRPHAYRFPVQHIAPDFQPQIAPADPTYLVVFRRRNDEVGFMALNAVSARLLDLLIENEGRPATELLRQIAAELGHPDPAHIVAAGCDILRTFLAREIILGTRPPRAA